MITLSIIIVWALYHDRLNNQGVAELITVRRWVEPALVRMVIPFKFSAEKSVPSTAMNRVSCAWCMTGLEKLSKDLSEPACNGSLPLFVWSRRSVEVSVPLPSHRRFTAESLTPEASWGTCNTKSTATEKPGGTNRPVRRRSQQLLISLMVGLHRISMMKWMIRIYRDCHSDHRGLMGSLSYYGSWPLCDDGRSWMAMSIPTNSEVVRCDYRDFPLQILLPFFYIGEAGELWEV